MSLRWQITITITLVSVLVTLALGLTVHFAYAYQQADEARRLQTDRLELAVQEYRRNGRPTLGSSLDDPDLPAGLRVGVQNGATATYVGPDDDGGAVWAATAVGEDRILSLRSTYRPRLDDLARLDRVLVTGGLTVIALGAGAGVVIGARLSARLRRAAIAARRVADGERGTRVEDAVGGRLRDEAADLARAVDAMADALQSRLDAERRVTADIAHELRTPITGLSTAADLLPPGRPSELVRDRARALRTLVENVLEVARLDTATQCPDPAEVALGEFTVRRATGVDPNVRVLVRDDAVVRTDPLRLERVLANLVANACAHGALPVEVEVDGPRITIRDHGPGFSEELLRDGPSRFRKGGDATGGHGLGLTIAFGQARVIGATITLVNLRSGGAQVIVDLGSDVQRPTGP
ncbi:HAMP domain-containing histidine kinase [Nocardiopsis sp. EMB25]|uniref:sensor histidine kinase n=1 Tax=Nocardiopsis sp. EMB25 TaxID=2835867 RepID=UPI00228395A7|nr:HAMP domain-containing sensor histidine kinase [Nocardiopsis sp. EMB25]MCY9782526.1 HAMP domain-containing histidine kinase [Nocardiopsis sp. EMB25]